MKELQVSQTRQFLHAEQNEKPQSRIYFKIPVKNSQDSITSSILSYVYLMQHKLGNKSEQRWPLRPLSSNGEPNRCD